MAYTNGDLRLLGFPNNHDIEFPCPDGAVWFRMQIHDLTKIRLLTDKQLPQYADAIRRSFSTVAKDFGWTRENCPGHTSFITDDRLAVYGWPYGVEFHMNVNIDTSKIRLETDRLILRAFCEDDLADFYEYASAPGVDEMAGWPHHESIGISKRILQSFMKENEVIALVLKENNKVIGSLGLHCSYACDDRSNIKPGHTGGVWVATEPIKILQEEFVDNVYDEIIKAEQSGEARIDRYKELPDEKKAEIAEMIKRSILKNGLIGKETAKSNFFKQHLPSSWKAAEESET